MTWTTPHAGALLVAELLLDHDELVALSHHHHTLMAARATAAGTGPAARVASSTCAGRRASGSIPSSGKSGAAL